MVDWLDRIRETAAAENDGSLLSRSAVQAKAAIDRSRARWGEYGLPYPLRGEGPAPESEWVWLGGAIVEAATDLADLDTTPSLMPFRIRDSSPLQAYKRLDLFQVAWHLPPDHEGPYLQPSGLPSPALPAEHLLEHAFDGWEADLQSLWEATPAPPPRGLLARVLDRAPGAARRADRRKRDAVYESVNRARIARFVGLVRVAYSPEALFHDRLTRLDTDGREAVLRALDGVRGENVAGPGPRAEGSGPTEAAS